MSTTFAPVGWAACNGQMLPVDQNPALFALLGDTYGGNAPITFALPNLQGRVPMGMSSEHKLAEAGGEQAHALTIAELPTHAHAAKASSSTDNSNYNPADNYLGGANSLYYPGGDLTIMVADTVGVAGGYQPHQNMQPYLTLTFCIALQGIFPQEI